MNKFIITEEAYTAVKAKAKENKNKKVDKRLQVIILRYEGKSYREISEKLDICKSWVIELCKSFCEQGLDEYCRNKYRSNHRTLSETEEDEILAVFRAKADAGQIVTVKEIKAAFDAKIGRDTGTGYIYKLLKRKGWRKVMPRSKHPKCASKETIEASKKLTKK